MNALNRALEAMPLHQIGEPALVAVVVIDAAGSRIIGASADAGRYPSLADQVAIAADVVRSKVAPRKIDPTCQLRHFQAERLARAAIDKARFNSPDSRL